MERKIHKIDAEGRILGRLATEVAGLLRGKGKVSFVPNLDQGDFVEVSNADKIKVTGNKLDAKKYYRYSGQPGGISEESLRSKMAKDPTWVIKNAVSHMIPSNRLRPNMIKRLKFVK